MNDIEKHVCEYYGVTLDEMKADLRNRKYSEPRQTIYYFLRSHLNLKTSTIAKRYNHTQQNVRDGLGRVILKMDSNLWYWLTIQELKFKINPGLHVVELGKIEQL